MEIVNEKLVTEKCIYCSMEFRYNFSNRKKNFKKLEMSYYKVITDNKIYYLHAECLERSFLLYVNDNQKMIIENNEVKIIEKYFASNIKCNKTNYINKINAWIMDCLMILCYKDIEQFTILFNNHRASELYVEKQNIDECISIAKKVVFKGVSAPDELFTHGLTHILLFAYKNYRKYKYLISK